MPEPTTTPTAPRFDEGALAAATNAERARCAEIRAIGKRFGCAEEADDAIAAGTPSDSFRDRVWSRQPETLTLDAKRTHAGMGVGADPGLSPRERARWQSDFWNHLRNRADDRVERSSVDELSDHLQRSSGQSLRTPGGVLVPLDYLPPADFRSRDLTVGTASAGGHLVETQLRPGDFAAFIRGRAAVGQMGPTIITGLVGNQAIPVQTGGVTASFVVEGAPILEGNQTFAQRLLTPKTAGVFTDVSRKLLLQSTPSAEAVVRMDLATAITTLLDQVALSGSGVAPIPRGIMNTVGVSSIPFDDTDGPSKYASIIAATTAIANANLDDLSAGWIATPAGRAALMQVFPDPGAGQPIWSPTRASDGRSSLLGWPAVTSTLLPTNLGVGTNEHALVYGVWSELFIGMWGMLEINADPYTLGDTGAVRLRGFLDLDVTVRRPEAFAFTSFVP